MSKKLQMSQHPDPLVRATRKAYRSSQTRQLDLLVEQRSKWLGRRTRAINKLDWIERQIRELCAKLIADKEGGAK